MARFTATDSRTVLVLFQEPESDSASKARSRRAPVGERAEDHPQGQFDRRAPSATDDSSLHPQ